MPPSSMVWSAIHLHRRERVLGGGGELVLGSVPVVDRDDDRARALAEVAAERIVGLVAAEHPPAAVEVGDDRMGSGAGRSVEPVLQVAGRAGQHAVDHLTDVGAGRTHRGRRFHERARRQPATSSRGVEGRVAAIISSTIATSGCTWRTMPSLHCDPSGAAQLEAEVVGGDDLVTDRAVRVDAADVGQEHARLSGHVGAHVPGVRRRVERDVGAVVDVLHPTGFGLRSRLDRVEAACPHVGEGVGDPFDVLLDRHRHVRQH